MAFIRVVVLSDDVIVTLMTWLEALDQDFFATGFSPLVSCKDRYLVRCDDYTEKYYDVCMCASSCISVVINAVSQYLCVSYFQNIPHAK
jgi:hypothetical protein